MLRQGRLFIFKNQPARIDYWPDKRSDTWLLGVTNEFRLQPPDARNK